MTSPRKSSARKAASSAPRTSARPRKAASVPAVAAAPSATETVSSAVETEVEIEVAAPPAGSIDLAGGLRSYLGAVDTEVRAVSALSERIDALVTELNDARDEQAKRLIVLDELRASVSDQSLGAFLDQAIKPRKTRVREIVPERLR